MKTGVSCLPHLMDLRQHSHMIIWAIISCIGYHGHLMDSSNKHLSQDWDSNNYLKNAQMTEDSSSNEQLHLISLHE